MASALFNPGRAAFGRGEVDWEDADIRCLLVKDTYVFNQDHAFVADLVAHELAATDYVRKALTGRQVGVSAPTYFTADNVLWAGLGGAVNETVGGLVIFVHTGNDATALLLVFCDNADLVTQNQDTLANFANQRVFGWS